MKRQCSAIPTQQVATQGLNLSPILASFQKVPSTPTLFLSRIEGQKDLIYAHVQINKTITVNKLWKLNRADIFSVNKTKLHSSYKYSYGLGIKICN